MEVITPLPSPIIFRDPVCVCVCVYAHMCVHTIHIATCIIITIINCWSQQVHQAQQRQAYQISTKIRHWENQILSTQRS